MVAKVGSLGTAAEVVIGSGGRGDCWAAASPHPPMNSLSWVGARGTYRYWGAGVASIVHHEANYSWRQVFCVGFTVLLISYWLLIDPPVNLPPWDGARETHRYWGAGAASIVYLKAGLSRPGRFVGCTTSLLCWMAIGIIIGDVTNGRPRQEQFYLFWVVKVLPHVLRYCDAVTRVHCARRWGSLGDNWRPIDRGKYFHSNSAIATSVLQV